MIVLLYVDGKTLPIPDGRGYFVLLLNKRYMVTFLSKKEFNFYVVLLLENQLLHRKLLTFIIRGLLK